MCAFFIQILKKKCGEKYFRQLLKFQLEVKQMRVTPPSKSGIKNTAIIVFESIWTLGLYKTWKNKMLYRLTFLPNIFIIQDEENSSSLQVNSKRLKLILKILKNCFLKNYLNTNKFGTIKYRVLRKILFLYLHQK